MGRPKFAGIVTSLKFTLESSDNGTWGMNTPAYFCIDNFNGNSPETPEPIAEAGMEDLNLPTEGYSMVPTCRKFYQRWIYLSKRLQCRVGSWSGFAASAVTDNQTEGWSNQYSAVAGSGALQTDAYAVAYVDGYSEIDFTEATVSGFYITNAT